MLTLPVVVHLSMVSSFVRLLVLLQLSQDSPNVSPGSAVTGNEQKGVMVATPVLCVRVCLVCLWCVDTAPFHGMAPAVGVNAPGQHCSLAICPSSLTT